FVADWADGQRPKRGRGRIYRITSAEKNKNVLSSDIKRGDGDLPNLVAQLNSASYHQRCQAQGSLERQGHKATAPLRDSLAQGQLDVLGRLHAIWVLAHVEG